LEGFFKVPDGYYLQVVIVLVDIGKYLIARAYNAMVFYDIG